MKSREIGIWIVLIVVILVGSVVWIMRSQPSATEVSSAVRPLPPLPADELTDQAFQTLQTREQNGNLPVSPVPADPVRVDPFH